ncbi:MAG: hydrogenase small subunit [Clostridia bacterium]|jgi:hydrogenase small subunit|nr:hydrogenase small subunit [Clostridia bacterium]MDH7572865.1 hydrogenase small subunit [Clostridia bacterium]
MRTLSRREFLKLCAVSTAGVSLGSLLGWDFVFNTFARAAEGRPTVVWLQGSACSGCSVSLLNSVDPPVADLILKLTGLKYHPLLMAAAGEMGVDLLEEVARKERGNFVLVVEGGIPTAERGRYCLIGEQHGQAVTMLDAVRILGNAALVTVAAGQCASFGGIPGAAPNPTGVVGVDRVLADRPVINLGLCPMHPDHFLGTVVHLLNYGLPELDELKRPKMFYPGPIHENCPRRPDFEAGRFASSIGEEGCLARLGCKGFIARADCGNQGWNHGVNWCIKAGAPCMACSEPYFPDHTGPFYGLFTVSRTRSEARPSS